MSWAALALALLQALPDLIALLKSIDERARSASDQQTGYNAAVADQIKAIVEIHQAEKDIVDQAVKDHAGKSGDDGLDQEFRRD